MAAQAPPDPLVGQVLADRFEIIGRIGEGGIGVVYKARQKSVDRAIAIKVLGAHVSSDPQWVQRFHNEARAAARLEHPNTVRIIDFGATKEGLLFIAMELLQGRSLADEITRIGRLPPQRVLRILLQMCGSLQEAHTQGIIHRDIKPDNVFLMEIKGGADFVKVLDFSVAKMDTPDAQATRAGMVFGTPAYMSPEQGKGVKLSPATDIYSCGIVAYEMLTGKPPFEGRLPMEVVMAHLQKKPPPLTGFPELIANMVMKALEKKPELRQKNADELGQECEVCLDTLYPRATAAVAVISPHPSGQAPAVGPSGQAPPPPAPPPGQAPPPAGVAVAPAMQVPVRSTAPEQKTMMAQPTPQAAGAGQAAPRPGQLSGPNKTVAFATPPGAMDPGGTMAMGPGQFALPSPQTLALQKLVLTAKARPSRPTSPLFWAGWACLGISLGLALHFFWPHGV